MPSLTCAGHVPAEGAGDLPVGEGGPPDVVGALLAGDGVGPGVGDDQRDLAVGDQVAHAEGDGRVHDADQGGHLVLLEQLLGRGHARLRPAALVGHHHLDRAPAELAALGVQVHAEAVLHVPAERRVHARLGDQQPHLDRAVGGTRLVLLEARPAARDQGDGQAGGGDGHETTGEATHGTLQCRRWGWGARLTGQSDGTIPPGDFRRQALTRHPGGRTAPWPICG